jgi:hypothetical protein
MAENAMRAYHVVLRTKGRTATRTPEALYGFRAQDVVEMYSQKKGVGPGLWYRLKDGRVIDAFGKRSSRTRSWYVLMHVPRSPIKERNRLPSRICSSS